MKSTNPFRSARYRWRANQVRAKARRRIERATAPLPDEPKRKVYTPRLAPHLWTITVEHRDGSKVILHSDELPDGRLTVSPSLMGRKISTALRFYKAQPTTVIESFIQFRSPAQNVPNQEATAVIDQLRLAPDGAPRVLRFPLSNGRPDAPQILSVLNAVGEQFGRSPWVREFTVSILPAWTGNNDQAVILSTITAFVRDRMRYLSDPEGGEYFIDPVTLIERIQTAGFAFGDCDDHVSLLNAMARSVGFDARAVGVHLHDPVLWDHVISQVSFNGDWIDIDPCVKNGETPEYREKLISA